MAKHTTFHLDTKKVPKFPFSLSNPPTRSKSCMRIHDGRVTLRRLLPPGVSADGVSTEEGVSATGATEVEVAQEKAEPVAADSVGVAGAGNGTESKKG